MVALTSLVRPAAAQVEPGVARAVDEFIGNTIELSILFSNAPSPGGVLEVRAGKTDVEVSKLEIDPDLPFGIPADTDDLDAKEPLDRPAPEDRDSPLLPPRWRLVPLVDVRLGMSTADRRASDIVPGGPRSVQVRVDSRGRLDVRSADLEQVSDLDALLAPADRDEDAPVVVGEAPDDALDDPVVPPDRGQATLAQVEGPRASRARDSQHLDHADLRSIGDG